MMIAPKLLLETSYDLSDSGRILRTREPSSRPGPRFVLQRSSSDCAWALRSDVPEDLAAEVGRLAQDEPPAKDLRIAPIHAEEYLSLLGGQVDWGPTFLFPAGAENKFEGVTPIDDLSLLQRNFSGWTAAEIPQRLPIMAVLQGGHAVSVCFSARRAPVAAEAGLETAAAFRGRGFGPRVTAAWSDAIRSLGLIPLYSTSWNNLASLSVARKLRLVEATSDWSLVD